MVQRSIKETIHEKSAVNLKGSEAWRNKLISPCSEVFCYYFSFLNWASSKLNSKESTRCGSGQDLQD